MSLTKKDKKLIEKLQENLIQEIEEIKNKLKKLEESHYRHIYRTDIHQS